MSLIKCSECGKEMSDKANSCPGCGAPVPYNGTRINQPQNMNNTHVDNHLAKAILVTIFCCIPFGIVSIVNAASVNGKLQAGDIAGARLASDKADTWANWAIGSGLLIGLIWFFAIVANS